MDEIDLTVDFKSFQEKVTSSLVETTKTAGQISNADLGFHRASSRKVSKALDEQNGHLLRLTNKLLKAVTEESNIPAPKLSDVDSIDDKWRNIVDVVDDLLEKADASLDEFSGVIKRLSPGPQDGGSTPPRGKEKREILNIFQNASMPKPQRLFDVKPNNYETKPFRPLLKTKPHGITSLLESIGEETPNGYNHPYAVEIEQYRYPSRVSQSATPIPFTSPTDSEAIYVDTEEAVQDMLQELKQAKEIAVDLEHHDMHSYIGLVSLMQISTRDKDWIVDTLKPWRENLECLNEVFADPDIIKVFHGSNMDIKWLQRDLGLYVVGLFDTFYAANALHFPAKSLKYLLERFANVKAQKKYQMADWRVRPLPAELIDYARSDTHYLLHIYDHLKNLLIEGSSPRDNLIDAVLEGSKKEALQVYERPIYDIEYGLGSGGWFKQVTQRSIKFDGQQLAVYKAVHHWRDQKAREWDEGEQSILTLAQLYGIAETMPITVPALYNTLRPISRLVATNSKELIAIIKRAKLEGMNGSSLRDIVTMTEEKFGPLTTSSRKAARKSPAEEVSAVASTHEIFAKTSEVSSATSETISVINEPGLNAGRSLTSLLWGTSLSGADESLSKPSTVALQALKSILPLPEPLEEHPKQTKITPVAMESTLHQLDSSAPGIAAPMPGTAVADLTATMISTEDPDQIFTLRDRKRKAEGDPNSSSTTNGMTLSAEDQARKDERKRRKAEKLAQKEIAAAATAQVQPFDYMNADSVLNPKVNLEEQKKQKAKVVNPYAKGLNTSTGAKRTNQEGPGKSFTFTK